MITNVILTLFGIILLGAIVFGVWMAWGMFFYGAPLVSTSKKVTKKMIELSGIHQRDIVYDLGCGTGSILFEVMKSTSGAYCRGYDLVKPAILFAQIKNTLLKTNIDFQSKDLFTVDLSDADVIFCYLLPEAMKRIYTEKWEELKPGCRIVSNGFQLPSLKPTHTEPVGKGKIYIYEK
jgi:precorrin-6B methylase 2